MYDVLVITLFTECIRAPAHNNRPSMPKPCMRPSLSKRVSSLSRTPIRPPPWASSTSSSSSLHNAAISSGRGIYEGYKTFLARTTCHLIVYSVRVCVLFYHFLYICSSVCRCCCYASISNISEHTVFSMAYLCNFSSNNKYINTTIIRIYYCNIIVGVQYIFEQHWFMI